MRKLVSDLLTAAAPNPVDGGRSEHKRPVTAEQIAERFDPSGKIMPAPPEAAPARTHAEEDDIVFVSLCREIDEIAAKSCRVPVSQPLCIVHTNGGRYPIMKSTGKRISYLARRLGAKPVALDGSGNPIAEGYFVGDGNKEYYDAVELLNRLLDSLGVPA
jgi:hypothetical protein